ncbi:MAG: HAMP domain-containing sensor histidine kinase, partial [Bacteroidales bacterium]|nr:HAMP domain-containing sensor histidine kinase [Bacteroidales bacterium]
AQAIERRAELVNQTDDFFERMKEMERLRITLWAEAVKQRAELVNTTDDLFNTLKKEERKRVELWAKAYKRLSQADTSENLNFYFDIIAGNKTIPVVITDQKDNIKTAANVDFDLRNVEVLEGERKRQFLQYEPIVSYDYGTISIIYYKESKIYVRLKNILDNLVQSFLSDVVSSSAAVPVIITDSSHTEVIAFGNLDSSIIENPALLRQKLNKMQADNQPIDIELVGHGKSYIFYENSALFTGLQDMIHYHISDFLEEVVTNSASVPVIVTDNTHINVVVAGGGIEKKDYNTPEKLQRMLRKMKAQNTPIEIDLPLQGKRYIYYENSFLLTQLRYAPIIQFLLVGLLMFAIYVLLNITRRSEQDQVWAGMAKETAHQLGTPVSSLLAWLELLRMEYSDQKLVSEVINDVKRLEIITERFSRIGSKPVLENVNLYQVINESVEYMKFRTSSKVHYIIKADDAVKELKIPLNKNLFQWVIENLLKNAVDAMNSVGVINIEMTDTGNSITTDIIDTGKGIPKSKVKMVFSPGYTTKRRGWGLGLSLSERIIKKYHRGRIYVKSTVVGKGTTFRIILKK